MAPTGELETLNAEGMPAHEGFLVYRRMRWAKIAAIACLVAILGYAMIDVEPRPNGGSWYGYTLGTICTLLIIWLSLLGIRKRAITSGQWSLKAWTSAHVYLGLALIILATLHTGFQFGWNVHTLAYVLMLLVILSGLYGVWAYASLPRALSDNRRNLTQEQMIEAIGAIDRQIGQASQPLGRVRSDQVIDALGQPVFYGNALNRLSGKYPGCATAQALAALPSDEETDRVRALLARRLGVLRQIRQHLRIRAMIEVWLYIHVPATVALLGALTAHIVSVFYYW